MAIVPTIIPEVQDIAGKERFWAKVRRCEHGEQCAECCWLWTGGMKPFGYGHCAYRVGEHWKQTSAHRLSWIVTYGDIPHGLCVLHNCPTGDNPACVNPHHLWLGTLKENTQDALKKGRFQWTERTLRASQIYEIRYLAGHGMSLRLLGHIYGVTKTNIAHIIHGRSWKHLPLIVEEL